MTSKKRKRYHIPYTDGRNRKHDGVAQFVKPSQSQSSPPRASASDDGAASGEWQTVKRKKDKKQNYPALQFSPLHQLHSMVRLSDLQTLILYCLADGSAPQWVSVRHHHDVKRVVILFVPGLEKWMLDGSQPIDGFATIGEDPKVAEASPPRPNDSVTGTEVPKTVTNNAHANRVLNDIKPSHPDAYMPLKLSSSLPDPLKPLADVFAQAWPIKAPGDERLNQVHSPLHAMLQSPIPKSHEEKRMAELIRGPKPVAGLNSWQNKRMRVAEFLASVEELLENEYTLHSASWQSAKMDPQKSQAQRDSEKQTKEHGWMETNVENLEDAVVPEEEIEKGSVTAGRHVLALDCEMCIVVGGESALTRISLLDWNGDTVMDELVRPLRPIIDYLTPYSGITPLQMASVQTSLEDIQKRLLPLLTPRTILVGHSLESDLKALKLIHPFIIDTSLIYPHPRGPPMKSSLKWLAQKYLSREIQKGHGDTGHDSIEDARAVLDLLKMKCEKGPKWGTPEQSSEPIFRRIKRAAEAKNTSSKIGRGEGQGAIIDWGDPAQSFGKMADFPVGCKDDEEVVAAVQRAVKGDEDGATIPGGGVTLTWARMRELEVARGWCDDPLVKPVAQNPKDDHAADEAPLCEDSRPLLSKALASTVNHIQQIYSSLPPTTLLVVYSGTGDPRPMRKLQDQRRRYLREIKRKKWDELDPGDRWTDTEEQALKKAVVRAREGVGFVCVK